MKKIAALLLLLTISVASFSQSTTTTSQLKTDYLKKSKHQQTTGAVILVSGVVLVITPLIVGSSIKKGGDATMGLVYGSIAAGFLCLPVSIPFFINAARYKKKGMSLSFKSETSPQILKSSFVYKTVPSLNLKISL